MYKLLAIAILSIITSQAMAQDDSTSVIIGFNVNGALAPIANTAGDPNRAWTQADTYLIPATTVNNTNTYNTYNTTTGGTCTNTSFAVVGYTPATTSQNYYFNGCLPTGNPTIPPAGSVRVYTNGGSCETLYTYQLPVWQTVCKP